jgi:hypothetical protein
MHLLLFTCLISCYVVYGFHKVPLKPSLGSIRTQKGAKIEGLPTRCRDLSFASRLASSAAHSVHRIHRATGPRLFVTVLHASPPEESTKSTAQVSIPLVKALYGFLWVALTTYAFGFSPGGSVEAAAADRELILKMITSPYDGTVSPLFVALFNALGIIPAVYAALLLPASKGQFVSARPSSQLSPSHSSMPRSPLEHSKATVPAKNPASLSFLALTSIAAAFFLGFFGIGPYLALRERRPYPMAKENIGPLVLENKLAAGGLLIFTLFLGYYALTGTPLEENLTSFTRLFSSQRLVHVSSLDFAILSVALVDPLQVHLTVHNSDTLIELTNQRIQIYHSQSLHLHEIFFQYTTHIIILFPYLTPFMYIYI